MTESPSSPADVVRSYLASFDDRNPDEIAAHVSDDFVNDHTAALGSGCVGRDEYRARLPDFLSSMPGLHYEIEHLVHMGDTVAVFYTMTGRWRDERDFTVRGAQRLVVRDGRIRHRTDYWDSAAFLRQVDELAATALRGLGID